MSIDLEMRNGAPPANGHVAGARVVKPLQFDADTPQTPGMRRLAAVSHDLVGSEKLWAGVMIAEPGMASAVHHHGDQETVVFVLSGRSQVRWGSRLEQEADLEAGDFLFIPARLPHQEINPSADQSVVWVVMRSARESVVVNLLRGPNGEYVEADAHEQSLRRGGPSQRA
jgi:uncharacterized RmlC-like cupin family protein